MTVCTSPPTFTSPANNHPLPSYSIAHRTIKPQWNPAHNGLRNSPHTVTLPSSRIVVAVFDQKGMLPSSSLRMKMVKTRWPGLPSNPGERTPRWAGGGLHGLGGCKAQQRPNHPRICDQLCQIRAGVWLFAVHELMCLSRFDAFTSSVRQGGCLELRFLAWAFWHSAINRGSMAMNAAPVAFSDWLTRMPLREGVTQLKLVPAYERWVMVLQTKATREAYWDRPSLAPGKHMDQFPEGINAWFFGGWYDSYTRSTFELFTELRYGWIMSCVVSDV